ncbi:MAG TPA: tetratricopeptide repeat protein [Smithella sp.]|nr:tetratricopeptide repeat protein [Smithella sp.]
MLKKINIGSDHQTNTLFIYIALTIITLAVFWQVNLYDFVNLDDQVYVTGNSHIKSGITPDSIRWAFGTKYFDLWHPLVWMSFMLDYKLAGPNAGGYHITNLILHIFSALLLFWLFNRMTQAIYKSAFVAALFALHPLHVESVAWIAERKDVLSAFFWMLTLCLYVYYTEKPLLRRYLPVVISFACALMSKPMVVTLPVVMLLLDYWPLGRFEAKKTENNLKEILPVKVSLWPLWEKIPFLILSSAVIIITLYSPDSQSVKVFPLASRLANMPVSLMTYLEKTLWPYDLTIFYPFSEQLPHWQVTGAALGILVISAAVIMMRRRLPYLFVGWLWYAITLLPVIGILQVGGFAGADRYQYLPSIGIAVMLAWGIPLFFKSENARKRILFPAGLIFIGLLSLMAWRQCGYWRDSITLFNHALRVTQNNYLAHNNIAPAFAREGKIEEAVYHYSEAIRLMPDTVRNNVGYVLYNNRGGAYTQLGRYQPALTDFNKAIALKPDYADSYAFRGDAYAFTGQVQQAIEDYNKAIALKPVYADAYCKRGTVYNSLHRYQSAVDDFNKTIRLNPDNACAYNGRGESYLNRGDKIQGCYDAQLACKLGNCKTLEAAKVKGLCR